MKKFNNKSLLNKIAGEEKCLERALKAQKEKERINNLMSGKKTKLENKSRNNGQPQTGTERMQKRIKCLGKLFL